jgi:hypothetical protein
MWYKPKKRAPKELAQPQGWHVGNVSASPERREACEVAGMTCKRHPWRWGPYIRTCAHGENVECCSQLCMCVTLWFNYCDDVIDCFTRCCSLCRHTITNTFEDTHSICNKNEIVQQDSVSVVCSNGYCNCHAIKNRYENQNIISIDYWKYQHVNINK